VIDYFSLFDANIFKKIVNLISENGTSYSFAEERFGAYFPSP